jgi:uncharacterized protein (DUF2336 family)
VNERRSITQLRPAATRERKTGDERSAPLLVSGGRGPALLAPAAGAAVSGATDVAGVAAEEMGYLFDEPTVPAPALDPRKNRAARLLGDALTQSRLAGMADGGVRQMLARKLCRLLPDLPDHGRDAAAGVAVRALEQLARDHAEHVRAALASAIKDVACAPPAVVRTLAQDIERSVAEPVLHYCATLTDSDLLEIVASRSESWALAAVARRARVSAPVSDAIIDKGDAEATSVLLDNSGAIIDEPALERIVETAAERREWQGKLAARPGLPPRFAVRLAEFVDQSVIKTLRQRNDFDDATISEVAAVARRRVDWIEAGRPGESAESRAVRLYRQDRLDETAIGDALSWEETDFVEAALSLRAAAPPAVVRRIMQANNPRAVTALAWRAGLSMRCAMQIQARAAGISPSRMLNARNGAAYPLTPEEMSDTLALYGLA